MAFILIVAHRKRGMGDTAPKILNRNYVFVSGLALTG